MSRPLFLAVLLFAVSAGRVCAQERDSVQREAARGPEANQGTVALTDWPESLPGLLRDMESRAPYLLPKLDSLGLDYRYAATDSTSRWSFVLGWRPGQRVLYEGEVVPRREGPEEVRMTNVELRAEVIAEGEAIGEMIVAVDSMALRSLPSVYSFEVEVGHDRVFLDVPSEEARRALRRGVTLQNIVVERMGFSSADARRPSDRAGEAPDTRRQEPAPRRSPSVYTPRTSVRIGWRLAPRPYYVDRGASGDGREVRLRGETAGQPTGQEGRVGDAGEAAGQETPADGERTGRDAPEETDEQNEGRTSGSDGGEPDGRDTKDDDDEDDGPNLRGPALVAAGAVALTAVIGGTVGLYGTGDTPLGLAAGYTHPRGGIQLQAAVSAAVLEDDAGQRLTAKALGFYDVFRAPVQPAVGAGVQIDAARAPNVRPSVSTGLVGNLGRIVLYGGVDVVQQTPEIGVTYNFRARGAGSDDDS
ncbi:MAG: hypothetical protein R6T83_11505 [Salinibacter sp.]